MTKSAQDQAKSAHWSLASLIKETPIPTELAGQIRAQQLDEVSKLTLVVLLGNLLNAAVVLMSFWNTGADNMLAIWGFTICLVSGFFFLDHLRSRGRALKKTRPVSAIDRFARGASVLGLIWATAPIIVILYVDAMGQMVLGIIMATMMFAGAFMLSRIPNAAFSFIIPMAVGLIVSFQLEQDPRNDFLSVLLVIYTGVLGICVQWSHRLFIDQILGKEAVSQQSQLIGLLLRDFEESTSDWLWQTDEAGMFQDIPLALAGKKNQYDVMSKGLELEGLFCPGETLTILQTSMERHQGFRDLVLKVEADEERWWSVTGKPVFENGKYTGFRGVASDVTQSKEAEDRIAHMAHYDGLTGLPNRMTLQAALEKAVREPLHPGQQRALLWLDLDNFKWVNDTLGHPAGDELLKKVAERINGLCCETDVVARLGGDEFALLVERFEEDSELESFLDDLTATLAEPYEVWGATALCSASIGVRLFDINTGDTRSLLKHADLALYEAKKQGRANWHMFTRDLDDKARAKREIENDLQTALENNELRVYFQPQIDAKTRELIGFESLVRWQHPKRGLIFPSEFIEHAEDSGLITRLGDWIIRAALEEARRLPENVRISVNISPLQIHSSSLLSTIVNALAKNEIAPGRLELEITETVLMNDTQFTLERLHQLKELGVRIALDDFGTGFSSLSYLRSFPFDKIKIDKSFISDLETSDDSRAITLATLNLAQSLGMKCTAEGVETEYQSNFLRDHGCEELQGFLISKALPLDKLQHLVTLRKPNEAASGDHLKLVSDALGESRDRYRANSR